jgi:hypothetical protein
MCVDLGRGVSSASKRMLTHEVVDTPWQFYDDHDDRDLRENSCITHYFGCELGKELTDTRRSPKMAPSSLRNLTSTAHPCRPPKEIE